MHASSIDAGASLQDHRPVTCAECEPGPVPKAADLWNGMNARCCDFSPLHVLDRGDLEALGAGLSNAGPGRTRRFYLLTTEPIVPGVRSFLKISPPFMTNFTRRVSEMSASGSPDTATMSANLPFVIDPT